MKQFPLVLYPNPILKKKSKKVGRISPDMPEILQRMEYTMEENEGVGLAAPQVGISEQMIIPRIVRATGKKATDEEGCLSLPGVFLKIRRKEEVEIEAQTLEGETVRIQAKGLGARIFQHEIDHLNGMLIINRASPLARWKIRKQLKKFING
ncbi:MAG: peptide deformylase [Candidatus Wildermuthbacteria bacterium]|nr:peptide deformylase [Candidatus Wildermuthbacteria bacterium]